METDDHDRRWAHKSQADEALQKLANTAERERAVVRHAVKGDNILGKARGQMQPNCITAWG